MPIVDYIKASLQQPRDSLSGGQNTVRYLVDLTALVWKQLMDHRAEGMAAELAYRTIFSMIPAVVLGLVLFRVVGGLENIETQVEDQLFSFFGVPTIPLDYGVEPEIAPEDVAKIERDVKTDGRLDEGEAEEVIKDEVAKKVDTESVRQAQASIRQSLSDVIEKVATIDVRSIGVIGLVLLLYAAVALADSTEQIFNKLYEAPEGRPIHLRLAIHWSIITLGTGMLALSLYSSAEVVKWFVEFGAGSSTELFLVHLLSIVASFVLLFSLYAFMPNTRVSLRAAAVGGIVASLLWELAKFGFQFYVAKAVPYSNLYGSLGLIPLFLFWIYLTWLIIIFGLILTYTIQTLRGRLPEQWDREVTPTLAGNPDWMLPIMLVVGRAFDRGEAVTDPELAEALALPVAVVHPMARRLSEAGLLRTIEAGEGSATTYTPARPLSKIRVDEVLGTGRISASDDPAWRVLHRLNAHRLDAAGCQTLADLVTAADAVDATD